MRCAFGADPCECGPCYDFCMCSHCWFGWRLSLWDKIKYRLEYIISEVKNPGDPR